MPNFEHFLISLKIGGTAKNPVTGYQTSTIPPTVLNAAPRYPFVGFKLTAAK